MQRMIPKQIKSKLTFKGLTVRDMVFLTVSLLLLVLFLTANFEGHFYFALGEGVLAGSLFFIKIDDRLYYELYTIIVYLFSKKKWTGDKQNGVDHVDGDVVKFKDGHYAGVLRIDGTDFFLLREEEQDRLISALSVLFMNLSEGQKISIVRLDRPIFLDREISDLKKKIKADEGDAESTSERARAYIRSVRLEELKRMNTNKNCFYYNAFYVVLYASSKNDLDKTLASDLKELKAAGIEAERIERGELVGFCKRTVTAAFDERTAADRRTAKEQQEFIAPKKVRFRSKTTEVDDLVETTYVVTRYPTETFNAWATELCSLPFTKVVISATPIDMEKAIKSIDRTASDLKDKYSHSSKLSSDTATLMYYESLQNLTEQLQSSNEVMLNVCTAVTVYDYKKEGRDRRKAMKKMFNRLGFRTSSMICRQSEGYRASNLSAVLPKAPTYTQGINSSSLAAAYPFVDGRVIEKDGVMLGNNSAPVIVDFLKRGDFYKNSNTVVLGGVGGGKSFFAKSLFVNLRSEGLRIFVLDPENEYSILAANLGGKVIDMGQGGNIINPFAVLCDLTDDEEEGQGNLLLSHITFLEEFFRTTLAGLGSENIELALSLLPKLYEEKGITEKSDLRTFAGKFPTFDDFLALLKRRAKGRRTDSERAAYKMIITFLSKFAKGGRFSFLWNGQTNLDAHEEFTVFNFQSLLANANKTVVSAQMLLLTQYLNNELIRNYNKIKRGEQADKLVIAIDEAHVFIDPHSPIALRFMKNSAKRCRKYGGMQIVLTQSVNDFLGNEDLERESKAVITECQYTFVFPLNASGVADFLRLYDKLDITSEEEQTILDLPRGTTFFIAHQRLRTTFSVVTPAPLRDLFEKKVDLTEGKPRRKRRKKEIVEEEKSQEEEESGNGTASSDN